MILRCDRTPANGLSTLYLDRLFPQCLRLPARLVQRRLAACRNFRAKDSRLFGLFHGSDISRKSAPIFERMSRNVAPRDVNKFTNQNRANKKRRGKKVAVYVRANRKACRATKALELSNFIRDFHSPAFTVRPNVARQRPPRSAHVPRSLI